MAKKPTKTDRRTTAANTKKKSATKAKKAPAKKIAAKETMEDIVPVDRREESDRRQADRRKAQQPVAEDRRGTERRKVQRRRQIDPTTCERDYSNQEIEFMHAIDQFKRDTGRNFPSCQDVLDVISKLGYEKVG